MRKKKQHRTSRVPLRQLARRYTSFIFAGEKLDRIRTTDLKNEEFWLLSYVLNKSPMGRTELLGEPHPRTLKELAEPLPTPFTDRVEAELRWSAATVLRYASDINSFIGAKSSFDQAILHADYDRAESIIAHIQDTFGRSIWEIEVRFLLAQLRGGFEANRTLFSEYQDDKTPGWIRLLAHFFSQRVEDSISASEYDAILNAAFASETEDNEYRRLKSYLRFRLNPHRFSETEDLAYVLHFEESHSVIDRYHILLRVVQRLLVDGSKVLGPELSSALLTVAKRVLDPRLDLISGFLRPDAMEKSGFGQTIHQILHSYTIGDYATAKDVALSALQQEPGFFELYELASKSALRSVGPLENPFPSSTIPWQILEHTHRVISRAPGTPASLEQLLRLSYQLDSLPIGTQLFAFYRQHSDDRFPLRNDPLATFSASVPTPRLSMAYQDSDRAAYFLANLETLYPSNAAITLFASTWQSISEGRYTTPTTPLATGRLVKYRAYVLETLGDFASALDAYHQLQDQSIRDSLLVADATTGRYRCCVRLGRILEAASILAEAAVSNPHLISGVTLREVLSMYSSSRETSWLRNIAWPILFCAADREGYLPSEAESLHDVLDDFLFAWDIRKPTDLRPIAYQFPRDSLVYLLRYLCTPTVLDSSIWYDSLEDLERERMQVCEWLAELDNLNREAYSAEIAELKRAATMRELTHKVDRSKIHVDTDGIKASLSQSFRERVNRCLAFTQLKRKEMRQSLEVFGFSELIKQADVVFVDSGFSQFCSLFNELKQRFISSNEYGLDSSLSQRIRHGTLSGAIRAIFETSRLVTQKDATGGYVENSYWLARLGISAPEPRYTASQSLARLSNTIDDTVSEVRNVWIQIKGPANRDLGMFDFDFDEVQLQELYQPVEELQDFDSFISFVFARLWDRTESDLERVRLAIQNELRRALIAGLDDCEQALQAVVPPEQQAEFRAAVTACQTHLAYDLASVAEWFRADHAQGMPDFRVGTLLDALLGVVARYSGPCRLDVKQRVSVSGTLPGVYFRALWDLMFILLDNIAKHAQLASAGVELSVEQDEDRLCIEVINALGNAVDVEVLRDRVAGIRTTGLSNAEDGMLRREGGSGFYKLQKIMKYDLRCREHDFVLTVTDDGRFSARLQMAFGEGR